MKVTRLHLIATLALAAAVWPINSRAELLMMLRGQPGDSIVFFELSGSTVVTDFSGMNRGLGSTLIDFDAFAPTLGSVNSGRLDLLSGSGSVRNLTAASEVPIVGLFLQDRTTLPSIEDRFGVATERYPLSVGDVIAWSGSGAVDLSQQGASFSDLTIGTGLGDGVAGPNPSGEVRLTIQAIPEPTSLALLLPSAALLTLGLRQRGIVPRLGGTNRTHRAQR
jgi:hypothetical protein